MARTYSERKQQIIDLTDYQSLFRPDKASEAVYREIVHTLNEDSRLGFDPFQLQIVTMMMTALSATRRARGNPYISQEQSGNTAEHSAHTVIEWDHLFERVNSSGINTLSIQEAQRQGARAALVHDWGEILGEASVFSSRVRDGSSIDSNGLGNIELGICTYAISLAAYCVAAGTPQYFYDKIAALTTEADVVTHGYAKIPTILAREGQMINGITAALKPEHVKAMQHLIELVEYAEQEKGRDFFHTLMKSIEHLQGTIAIRDHATAYVQGTRDDKEVYRPFIELARETMRKDEAFPSRPPHPSQTSSEGLPVVDRTVTVDSLFVTGNFFYNEADLGHIWHLAENDPLKQALARQHNIDVYATLLTYLDRKVPVFRRTDQKTASKDQLSQLVRNIGITKEGVKPGEDSESYAILLKQVKSFHQPDNTFLIPAQTLLPDGTFTKTPFCLPADALLPVETASRIKRLYQAAITLVQQDRFHPLPGEILFTMDNAETQQAIAANPVATTEHKLLREVFTKRDIETAPAALVTPEPLSPISPPCSTPSNSRAKGRGAGKRG